MNEQAEGSETGFGLVEILVSVMLLMVIALSMLPVVISALEASGTNVSVASATQLASKELDNARKLAQSCDAIKVWAAETTGLLFEDPRGVDLMVHRDASNPCPSTYPVAYKVSAWVTYADDPTGPRLAEVETRVFMERLNVIP